MAECREKKRKKGFAAVRLFRGSAISSGGERERKAASWN